MKTSRIGVLICVCAALSCPAIAQTDRFTIDVTVTGRAEVAGSTAEHFLTFSGPVQLPGVSLAAGTYIFRVVVPSVIQVVAADRSEVFAMFTAMPAVRRDASSGYGVTLTANRYDAPVRLAKLFTPGSSTGFEFIYPPLRPHQDFVVPFTEGLALQ